MKNPAFSTLLKCALVVMAGMPLLVMANTETNATNATLWLAPKIEVKSVFVDDPRVGKDPFFPNSTRRQESLPVPNAVTNIAQQSNLLLQQLALKGISGAKGQRLALINTATVSEGELAEIRFGPQVVKIRCREIRDRSVIIELDGLGERKELKLREGI
jgi:hypothetical protein